LATAEKFLRISTKRQKNAIKKIEQKTKGGKKGKKIPQNKPTKYK
jgi:hypothetical protein